MRKRIQPKRISLRAGLKYAIAGESVTDGAAFEVGGLFSASAVISNYKIGTTY